MSMKNEGYFRKNDTFAIMLRKALLLPFLIGSFLLRAQPSAPGGSVDDPTEGPLDVFLTKTDAGIIIDGKLDEAAWFDGRPAVHFGSIFQLIQLELPIRRRST